MGRGASLRRVLAGAGGPWGRARRLAPVLAAPALDAGYLVAWALAPGAPWAPWAIVAGLALGAHALALALRRAYAGEAVAFVRFVLPLALPASAALLGHRPARAATAPAPGPGRRELHRRAGLALLLLAAAALTAGGAVGERVVDPIAAPMDARAEAYVDRALVQAGAAYVGARVLDRLLALAADIQIDLLVIQGRPGQIFDPLRDLLDRFAAVVLVALGSLTLQKILLQVSGDVALAFFGAAALGALVPAVAVGRRRIARPLWAAAGLLLGTAVFLRLLLPLAGVAVAEISERVLAGRQQAALTTIEGAAGRVGIELDLAAGAPAPAGASLGQSVGELKDAAQALRTVDEGWLRSLFDALVELVAVFVIETVIAPLVVLFLLWRLWRRLAAGAPASG